jgi:hypothetical protein
MRQYLARQIQGPRHLEKRTLPNGRVLIWDETVGQWFDWELKGTGDSAGALESESSIEGS